MCRLSGKGIFLPFMWTILCIKEGKETPFLVQEEATKERKDNFLTGNLGGQLRL
jgi:hypothetical protein